MKRKVDNPAVSHEPIGKPTKKTIRSVVLHLSTIILTACATSQTNQSNCVSWVEVDPEKGVIPHTCDTNVVPTNPAPPQTNPQQLPTSVVITESEDPGTAGPASDKKKGSGDFLTKVFGIGVTAATVRILFLMHKSNQNPRGKRRDRRERDGVLDRPQSRSTRSGGEHPDGYSIYDGIEFAGPDSFWFQYTGGSNFRRQDTGRSVPDRHTRGIAGFRQDYDQSRTRGSTDIPPQDFQDGTGNRSDVPQIESGGQRNDFTDSDDHKEAVYQYVANVGNTWETIRRAVRSAGHPESVARSEALKRVKKDLEVVKQDRRTDKDTLNRIDQLEKKLEQDIEKIKNLENRRR